MLMALPSSSPSPLSSNTARMDFIVAVVVVVVICYWLLQNVLVPNVIIHAGTT